MARSKSEVQDELTSVNIELLNMLEDIKDESKAFNVDEVKARQAELQAKRDNLCKELADLEKTVKASTQTNERGALYDPDEWLKAATERRALQIGTVGSISRTMHKGMLTGAGTDKKMRGIYVSAKASTAGQTALGTANTKISELAKLSLSVLGKSELYTLLMNPSVYQTLLADSTTGEDVKIHKEGLIRDKSIEGVPLFLDSLMTAGTAAGDLVVVAVPLSRYAIGIAQQLVIEPIKKVGDTNTYFQATMFFAGKQISDKDIYSLVVKS